MTDNENQNCLTSYITQISSIVENEKSLSSFPEISDTNPPCCGQPNDQVSGQLELPGYSLWHFVENFTDTQIGRIPRIKTKWDKKDLWGMIKVRFGICRDHYKIAPGIYCIGYPGENSPVLVTANYKLSFDILRCALDTINAWVLVLDTRGINVWCAAGKGTFSTDEVVRQVRQSGLDTLIQIKELILPQLSAVGVSAKEVKKKCGFKIIWGPIRAEDLKAFLNSKLKATPAMRQVTFSFFERVILIPVELSIVFKQLLWLIPLLFVISGIGSDIFSLSQAWEKGFIAITAMISGILGGAIFAPALLPWIPGKAFSIKGAFSGIIAGVLTIFYLWGEITGLQASAVLIFTTTISSYLAMNFTGATPFTSPSGVEKEMKKAIPIQVVALILAVVIWLFT